MDSNYPLCSQWRQLALKSPILWRIPYLKRQELAQEMIKRAGNVPLCLEVDTGYLFDSEAVADFVANAIQDYLHRSRSLVLKGPFSLYFELLTISSAPYLTELRVEIYVDNSFYVDLFSNLLPNLTEVYLIDCELLDFPCSILPNQNVRILSIDNRKAIFGGPLRASLQNVLESLAKFPKLQTLALFKVFASNASGEHIGDTRPESLSLPQLSEIHLLESTKTWQAFLAHLRCCRHAGFSVELEAPKSQQDKLEYADDILHLLVGLAGRLDSNITHLKVDLAALNKPYCELHMFRSHWKGAGRPDFVFQPCLEASQILELLPRMLRLPVLQQLESSSYVPTHTSKELWISCGKLPRLRHLKVWTDHPDLPRLLGLQAVRRKTEQETSSVYSGPPSYFCSLKVLSLSTNWRKDQTKETSTWVALRPKSSANFAFECERRSIKRAEVWGNASKFSVVCVPAS